MRSRGRFFGGMLVGILIAALVGMFVVGPLALTHRDTLPLEEAYADTILDFTTRLGARNVGVNPVAGTPQAVQAGRTAYNGLCAQCHGPAGQGDGVFGTTTFPPAADLTDASARGMNDGQLFYVIKNGLGFTPMPAFGEHYSDQTIWALVTYVRTLQAGETGQTGRLPVPTQTGAQATAVRMPTGGDAQRGAVLFRSEGCVGCHGTAPGQVALNPLSTTIAQTVRSGRTGMPCFATSALPDAGLADIIAYISTFPSPFAQVAPVAAPGAATPTQQPGGSRPILGAVVGSPRASGSAAPSTAAQPSGAATPGGSARPGGGGPPPAPFGGTSPCASSNGLAVPLVPVGTPTR